MMLRSTCWRFSIFKLLQSRGPPPGRFGLKGIFVFTIIPQKENGDSRF